MVYDNCNCPHCTQKKFVRLLWQVDNVLTEAGSLMQAEAGGLKFDVLTEAKGFY